MLRRSHPIVLDATPAAFEPIIQVIDIIYRNHKLGVYVEMAVDDRKFAVCTLDLSNRATPEVRQFGPLSRHTSRRTRSIRSRFSRRACSTVC